MSINQWMSGAQTSSAPSRKQSENAPQQSARAVHASPSAAHVERHASDPTSLRVQCPPQHSLASAQGAPSARQGPGGDV